MIRVGIVDRHEIVREGFRAILQSEPDFTIVAESESADSLAELPGQVQPDVILLHACVTGPSGPTACKLLATTHPGTAVVVVSNFSDDDSADAYIGAGAKGYLLLDIERSSLKDSLRAVHRGESTVSPAVAARALIRLREAEVTVAPTTPRLSGNQREILRLIAEGFSNKEIAPKVYLSENTVKSHIRQIFRKLHVHNRVAAAFRAAEEGWL